MSGNEIITITIEDPQTKQKISTTYSLEMAESYTGRREEFHLLTLDHLVEMYRRATKLKNSNPIV